MFRDRFDAGEQLAAALAEYKNDRDAIILAIPRGALQIGKVLHERLGLPLDIIVTKKISHPMSEEFAIGAVGPDGEHFLTQSAEGIDRGYIESERKRLEKAVEEKYERYRGRRPKPDLAGKTAIIVDDGIATGSTIIAAIHVIRKQGAAKIVVAVPVGPSETVARIAALADEMHCLLSMDIFYAIGQFYEDFVQVEDEEAIAILRECSG
ncbi:MAG TPA: phosphoribosyltransferase family protein [Candidatus Bilamarchaeum sp.]|nr:phosphoribosyltransferase family protein [Candidatus Bilamarchaeum sp.]